MYGFGLDLWVWTGFMVLDWIYGFGLDLWVWTGFIWPAIRFIGGLYGTSVAVFIGYYFDFLCFLCLILEILWCALLEVKVRGDLIKF